MSTVTGSTYSNDLYASLGLGPKTTSNASSSAGTLQQADFLKLMTAQLQHQDPTNPMDNSQMMSQLAQITTVQGIENLNTTVNGFSSTMTNDQILRGAALVGHSVLVPSGKAALAAEGGVTGAVAAPSAGTLNVTITDAAGNTVRTLSVPATEAGEAAFQWDGNDAAGNRMAAGKYTLNAKFTDSSGDVTTLDTYVQGKVDSVTVGSDGVYINLPGLGTAPMSNVLRIS
jgi:flagellar basal-body rod modification protein FlgD